MNKTMTEHPTTIDVLRKEFHGRVIEWLGKNLARHDLSYDYSNMLALCSTLQLHALCRLIDRKIPDLILCRCNPLDHVAVNFAGMYVGIETDGYTHS